MNTYDNTRFTLMTFPQKVDASGKLSVNILFVPRNISPLDKTQTVYNIPGGLAEAFADVKPEFQVVVVNNPDEFPGKNPVPPNERFIDAPVVYSSNVKNIYSTLKTTKNIDGNPKYFDIDESRSADKMTGQRAPHADAPGDSVKKYLPLTYRNAFNFTTPRTPNAVIDDSYLCAIRDQKPPVPFVKDDKVSWGKVYAHLLRQPLLAIEAGLLYQATVQVNAGELSKGGWIYVTIKPGTTYSQEFDESVLNPVPSPDGWPFIKRYAARVPILKAGAGGDLFEKKDLFAAVLFPVMNKGKDPVGIYDEMFMEAALYNEGFATVVHANQPVSQNLLKEEQDGIHPQKEIGIRLGWEDEQILVWYMRQLAKDENTGDRLDAPLGVNGYHIDVWNDGSAAWESLTAVERDQPLDLEGIKIGQISPDNPYRAELPYQVYPSKVYGATTNYWLPVYFANWNDSSLVIPDKTAAMLYVTGQDKKHPTMLSETYVPQPVNIRLVYGNHYKFRARMSDISGGGPEVGSAPSGILPGQYAEADFKRYVAPNLLRIMNESKVSHSKDEINFSGETLTVRRPLLGYPSVVYTGKYPDPVALLKAASDQVIADQIAQAFGIADPDVVKVEIKVEVETLRMDNLASDSGRENYITLFTTFRNFDPGDYEADLDLDFVYKDIPVLNLTGAQPFPDPADNATILADNGDIILPNGRNIRLTIRAAAEGNGTYWGHINSNHDLDSRYGKATILKIRRSSLEEMDLLSGKEDARVLQGIYLQPDPVTVKLDPVRFKKLQGRSEGMPDIVQRLAKQLNLESKDMTLTSKNGERLVFWCSNLIRHSMAPDNSSITFANKNELPGHWLVCMNLYLNRDWSWDGLETRSMIIERRRCWGKDLGSLNVKEYSVIGDLEMRRIASFQAIREGDDNKVHRETTRIVLIDVIDLKTTIGQFPDTGAAQYRLTPVLAADPDGIIPPTDGPFETEVLKMPTTINPSQTPKIVGAGIALSPYNRNARYSETEARKKFLWLELENLPLDPDDDIFCRMLAYAPDQLLSNNQPDLMDIPEELPLPIDPEYIREVIPASGEDQSGLNAMQKMEKSLDAGRHFYLLPLPPGLHPESPELFGMFTYEFRYGHSDRIWSTARGRFGRELRISGLQHPAPTLLCTVQRDDSRITVSAPFAKAVFNGRNVTSRPPRTSLWCLLYAQVKQADGLDYRNILLDEAEMKPRQFEKLLTTVDHRLREAKEKGNKVLEAKLVQEQMEIRQLILIEREQGPYAFGAWFNKDVNSRLDQYGLPHDSSLSVLCVEIYGQITNILEHIDGYNTGKNELILDQLLEYNKRHSRTMKEKLVQKMESAFNQGLAQEMESSLQPYYDISTEKQTDPLNKELGLYRILRTSPLTEVPFICCKTEC